MTEHLDFDVLSELAAGELNDDEQRVTAERHVAFCSECAAQLANLRELLVRVHQLPASIDPPSDLWRHVRAAIDDRQSTHLARSSSAWWRRSSTWLAIAAAIVLVVSSSAVTALVLRERAGAGTVVAGSPPPSVTPEKSLPAALALVEAGYDDTARRLEATLALQQRRLSPKTVATVRHSLEVIDAAIAEARWALLEDPSNRGLVDIFAANYEHKLELLRRATELTSSL